jgi:hypothetical protein
VAGWPWLIWLSRPGVASGSHCATRATPRARAIASPDMEQGRSVRPHDKCKPNEPNGLDVQMGAQAEPYTQEVLAGLVERVTYHNAENGF